MTKMMRSEPARRAMPSLLSAAALACTLLTASPGVARLPGLPDPAPIPQATFQVFAVPGVYSAGYIDTEFFCTSLETSGNIHIGVQLVDYMGIVRNTGKGNGDQEVVPGQTVTIGTADSPSFAEDQVIEVSHVVENGYARIWSTSSKLMCSAVLVSGGGNEATAPPTGLIELKVIKAKTQTGD